MTSPDNKVPLTIGAITNPGLAGWAAMTQQDWEDWMRSNLKVHIDPLESFFDGVQNAIDGLGELIEGIVSVITGGNASGALVKDAVAALTTLLGWIRDLKNTVGKLLDGLAGVVGATVDEALERFTDLMRDFWALIHGLVGSSGTVAAAVAYLTGIYTNLKQLVDGLGGVANSTVAAAVAAFNKLKTDLAGAVTNLQALVDGIWKAFTGGTGAGKSIAEAVSAITNWLLTAFQGLVDGIVGVIIPGSTNRPVLDAINAIGSIFGTATNADTSAAQANAAIEAIKAAQAGGFSDEFELPLAASMPTDWMRKNTAINDAYGPDGKGSVVGKVSGNATGPVQYVQTTKPCPNQDCKVTATLSRLPWWDAFVQSSWFLLIHASAAINNRSALGVEILNTQCQFFRMDAAGTQTNIGARHTIPENRVGVPYTLEYSGTGLVLKINGIVAAQEATAAMGGRCIGFGGYKVPYVSPNDNPLAQFAGIAWQ